MSFAHVSNIENISSKLCEISNLLFSAKVAFHYFFPINLWLQLENLRNRYRFVRRSKLQCTFFDFCFKRQAKKPFDDWQPPRHALQPL